MRKQAPDPFGRPASFVRPVDAAQRLKGGRVTVPRAKRMMRAAHRQYGRAGGPALVEDVELRLRVAAELKRDEGQQHGLARSGRANNEHMADIAYMG